MMFQAVFSTLQKDIIWARQFTGPSIKCGGHTIQIQFMLETVFIRKPKFDMTVLIFFFPIT